MTQTFCSNKRDATRCKSGSQLRFPTQICGMNDLRVLVSKGQIISGGLFRKSILKVKIATTPTNWKVERSLDDFKWLHSALKSRFPMNYIMEFPTISPSEDQLSSDEFYLTGYLTHIIQSPELLYSQELEDFLKLEGAKFAQIASVTLCLTPETCDPSVQEAEGFVGLQPKHSDLSFLHAFWNGGDGSQPRYKEDLQGDR